MKDIINYGKVCNYIMIKMEIVSVVCSMDCYHCPYSIKNNRDEYIFIEPDHSFKAQSGDIYILTGGEPFESPLLLQQFINEIIKRQALFRIATGGHVDLRSYYIELVSNVSFLGLNFGTDVLLRSKNNEAKKMWQDNWKIFRQLQNTWLTITLSSDLSKISVYNILNKLKPRTVMLNECEGGFSEFDNYTLYLQGEFPNIYFIGGYRHEI